MKITASSFHQWNSIAGHVVPIILAFFMGAWSDKRGRKLPLLFGLFGKFYYSCMIIVNALMGNKLLLNILLKRFYNILFYF